MPKFKRKSRPYCYIINDWRNALHGRQHYQQEIIYKIYQTSPVRTGINFQLELGEISRGFGVTSFDLEPKENRYLLCSIHSSPYKVSIFDTLSSLGTNNYSDYQSVFKLISRGKRRISVTLSDAYSCIQWYPKDTGIFTTSTVSSPKIQIWDTNRMKVAEEINVGVAVKYHDMSKTGLAALATNRGLRLVDLRTGSSIHKTAQHEESKNKVSTLKWHPAQASVVTAGYLDGKIRLWDIRSSKEPLQLLSKLNSKPVKDLLFCPNNRTLVSVHHDVLKIWDTFDIGRGERSILIGNSDDRFQLTEDGPTDINGVAVSSKSNLLFIFKQFELFTYDLVKRKLHTHPSLCQNISQVILDEYNPSRILTLDRLGSLDVLSYNHREEREVNPNFDYTDYRIFDQDNFLPKYQNSKTPIPSYLLPKKSKEMQQTKKPDRRKGDEARIVGENSGHVKESGDNSTKSKSKFDNKANEEKSKSSKHTQSEISSQSKVYEKKLLERKELWEKCLKESVILSRMLRSSTEEGLPDEWSSEED